MPVVAARTSVLPIQRFSRRICYFHVPLFRSLTIDICLLCFFQHEAVHITDQQAKSPFQLQPESIPSPEEEYLFNTSHSSESHSTHHLGSNDYSSPTEHHPHGSAPHDASSTSATSKIPRIVTKEPTFDDEEDEEEAYEDDDEDDFFKLKPLDVPVPRGEIQVSMSYQPDTDEDSDAPPMDNHATSHTSSGHDVSIHPQSTQTAELPPKSSTPSSTSSNGDSSPEISLEQHEAHFTQEKADLEEHKPESSHDDVETPPQSSTPSHTNAFIPSGTPHVGSIAFLGESSSDIDQDIGHAGFATWTSSQSSSDPHKQGEDEFAGWVTSTSNSSAHDVNAFPDESGSAPPHHTSPAGVDDGFAAFDAPTLSHPDSASSTPTPQQHLDSKTPHIHTPASEEGHHEASTPENEHPQQLLHPEASTDVTLTPNPDSPSATDSTSATKEEQDADTMLHEKAERPDASQDSVTEPTHVEQDHPSDSFDESPSDIPTSASHSSSDTLTQDFETQQGKEDEVKTSKQDSLPRATTATPVSSTPSELPPPGSDDSKEVEEFESRDQKPPQQPIATNTTGFDQDDEGFAEWSNSNANDGDMDAFADFDAQDQGSNDDFDFPDTQPTNSEAVELEDKPATSSVPASHVPIPHPHASSTHESDQQHPTTVPPSTSTPSAVAVPQGKPSVFEGSPSVVSERIGSILHPLNLMGLDLKQEYEDYLSSIPTLEAVAGAAVLEQKWEAKDSKRAPKPAFRGTHFESEFLSAIGKQPLPTLTPGLERFVRRDAKSRHQQLQGVSPSHIMMVPSQTLSAKESASISAALGLTPAVASHSTTAYEPPATASIVAPSTPSGTSKQTSGSHLITPTQFDAVSAEARSANHPASPIDVPLAPVDLSMFGPSPPTSATTPSSTSPTIVQDGSSWMNAFMTPTPKSSATPSSSSDSTVVQVPPSSKKVESQTTSHSASDISRFFLTPSKPETPSSTPTLSTTMIASPVPLPVVTSTSSTHSTSSSDISTPTNLLEASFTPTKPLSVGLFADPLNRSGSPQFGRSSSRHSLTESSGTATPPVVEFEEGDEIGPVVHLLLKAMPNLDFMHHSNVVIPRRS